MYLVDTSVWIDFLRGQNGPAVEQLEAIIDAGEASIDGIIFNEICLGAKDKGQFDKYFRYFKEIPFCKITAEFFFELAKLRFSLKKKGVTAHMADSMIALMAINNGLTLLTKDKDFLPIAKHSELQLRLVSH